MKNSVLGQKLNTEEKDFKPDGEIILYQPEDNVSIEVWINQDTVWLNRQQLATLFDRDVKTIGKHINNALREELSDVSTIANFAKVQYEGKRLVNRTKEFFNLDMVLSVGYRVKSDRGVKYRRWANRVLKEYLLKGVSVNNRLERLDEVYHIGASIKDVGKKWFAFTLMRDIIADELIERLKRAKGA